MKSTMPFFSFYQAHNFLILLSFYPASTEHINALLNTSIFQFTTSVPLPFVYTSSCLIQIKNEDQAHTRPTRYRQRTTSCYNYPSAQTLYSHLHFSTKRTKPHVHPAAPKLHPHLPEARKGATKTRSSEEESSRKSTRRLSASTADGSLGHGS